MGIGTSPANLIPSIKTLFPWLVVLAMSSVASFYLRGISDSLLLYLPISVSIIVIHWLGWRALWIIYINGLLALFIWKAEYPWWKFSLMATHECLVALGSKLLVDTFLKKDYRSFFDSTNSLMKFVFFGVMIPVSVNSIYIYNYSFVLGDWEKILLFWLADYLTVMAIALPMLYFFKPAAKSLLVKSKSPVVESPSRENLIVVSITLIVYVLLSFEISFQKYWFIYGIGAVVIGLRYGFEWALLVNLAIFILNYMLPLIDVFSTLKVQGSTQLLNVHLGSAIMMLISLVVGRVISDLQLTEKSLMAQKLEVERTNQQLKQANQELDRFVYSVSHDLSAPLKSIQGLINVSKIESSEPVPYLLQIEQSVQKLQDFIDEVLDYSRTNRAELAVEEFRISELYQEVRDKFTHLPNFSAIRFETNFQVDSIKTDKFLLKIVLSNLLSNAIKYQQEYDGHTPLVKVFTSFNGDSSVQLEVMDNGEGIREKNQHQVFEMFYRGTVNSTGSGLGLYIAKEAVEKLGGSITFTSKYGEGTNFKVTLGSIE